MLICIEEKSFCRIGNRFCKSSASYSLHKHRNIGSANGCKWLMVLTLGVQGNPISTDCAADKLAESLSFADGRINIVYSLRSWCRNSSVQGMNIRVRMKRLQQLSLFWELCQKKAEQSECPTSFFMSTIIKNQKPSYLYLPIQPIRHSDRGGANSNGTTFDRWGRKWKNISRLELFSLFLCLSLYVKATSGFRCSSEWASLSFWEISTLGWPWKAPPGGRGGGGMDLVGNRERQPLLCQSGGSPLCRRLLFTPPWTADSDSSWVQVTGNSRRACGAFFFQRTPETVTPDSLRLHADAPRLVF